MTTENKNKWHMVGFQSHAPRVVFAATLEDLQEFRRLKYDLWDDPGSILDGCQELTIDRGGPFWANRSMQSVDIDGLRLSVPTMELLAFITQLRTAQPVDDLYEIRGDVHVVVLTATQRLAVLDAWQRLESNCRAAALEETLRTEAALRAANEHPDIQLTPQSETTPTEFN